MEFYGTDLSIDRKSDNSPVTVADMAAHKVISDALEKLTPDIPILSEESAEIPYSKRRRWSHYWLVDPLDGTREFIKRNDEFTVNIALIERHRAKLGIIYIPVTGTCYCAAESLGAYKITKAGIKESMHTKTSRADDITLVASRSHHYVKQQALVKRLHNATIITTGSSLKFCLLAEGKADIYPRFGPTSEWDTAAAQCIVEEAGGNIVTMDFTPLRYNTKSSLLNPEFLVLADPSFNWKALFTDLDQPD